MSVDILAVHGVGNWTEKAPAEAGTALARTWSRSLGHRSLAAAYYSHHLRRYAQGTPDLDTLDHDLNGVPGLFLAEWISALPDAPAGTAQGRLLAPIRQLASWFVERYGLNHPVVDRFLATFLAEVALYFADDQTHRRQACRLEAASAITTHQPRIVIAHSLGSVVTYETLHAYPGLHVELLVTIGSPLALPNVIFHKLVPPPSRGQGAKPSNVDRWISITDPADLVAVSRPLAAHFTGVDADHDVSAGAFFTHQARAYLKTRTLRTVIREHLNRPTP